MNVARLKSWLVSAAAVLVLAAPGNAQAPIGQITPLVSQSTLGPLPEADAVIYLSPQKIFTELAPKVAQPSEVANMRATFVDWKRSIGIDPASIESLAVAIRFNKPATDLSFVAPDVVTIARGDFSADSLINLVGLYVQDKAHTENHGSKTLTVIKIDSIAEEAAKNPLLKSFTELAVVALNPNTIAFGNVDYVKASVDAADGNGQMSSIKVASLLRDPNTLISVVGSPLTAFAKSFGMLGTQTVARESRCETKFGEFYAAININGTNLTLRGAMNTDNPDTAKIINGLLSGLFQQAVSYVPEKETQDLLKNIRILPKGDEIVFEADVPQATIADFIRNQTKPKQEAPAVSKPATKPKRRVRRK